MGTATLITNGHVLRGDGSEWQLGTDVLIVDGCIAEIGSGLTTKPELGRVEVIDATGRWIIPGLVDCHDHLFNRGIQRIQAGIPISIQRERIFDRPDALLAITAMANAQQVVSGGVTTVRDLGSRAGIALAVRDAVADGMVLGPRVLAAGQAITMSGGHFARHSYQADGIDAVRRGVRLQLAAGADVIKLMASGGLTGFPRERPGHVELSVEELRAGVEVSHAAERRVAAHAQAPEAIKNALQAGVDSIEHGFLMESDQASELAARNCAFTPTLNTLVNTISGMRIAGDDELADVLESEILPHHEMAFRACAEHGVLIGAGTDSTGTLAQELELMVALGMSPTEALRTATINAAEICGISHLCGKLAPGFAADLAFVRADPLADITAIRQIDLMMIAGQAFASPDRRSALGGGATGLTQRSESGTRRRGPHPSRK